MEKKTDKKIKRKPKQKQKQKQRQKQSQNVIVNVTQPKSKSQSEERSFIPMMPSFNSPAPIIQQSPLSDLAKLIGFLTPQMKSGVSLGSSIPEVEPREPIAKKEFGGFYNRNDNESFLGSAISNTIKATPKIEDINMFDEEVESEDIPIKRTAMSTTKISKISKPIEEAVIVPPIEEDVIVPKSKIINEKPRKPYTPMQEPTIAELRRDYLERFGEIVPKKTQKNKIKNALIANQKLGKSNVI